MLAWEKWYADKKNFGILKQISLGWHLPNTVDVSCKTHVFKKKNDEKKCRNRGWNQCFCSECFKEGPGDQDTKKTYLPVLSTLADDGKQFNADVSQIFTSELITL